MLVIQAGQLIDGTGAQPRHNVLLYVEHSKIVDILEAQAAAIPDGVERIDASSDTVMPGMIDAHVHVMWSGVPGDPLASREGMVCDLPGTFALNAYVNARQDLLAGFTALRDMLSYDFVDVSLRNAINKGLVEGPRISACGYGLTATGGHMDLYNGLRPDVRLDYFNNVVDTPEEARKAVRFLVRMGVDHIKINAGRGYWIKGRPILFAPEMRQDVLHVICEEAHTAGRKVAAHSLGSQGEYWAVEAGVDSLEHAHFIDDATIELMAERGTYLVPTMTHCVRNTMEIRKTLPQEKWPDDLILNAYDSMYRVIPKAFRLGVRIAVGTDAGADNVPHGCNAMELELLTTIGMTPMQAIVAATRTGAETLDMADTIGVLEKGKFADLLVVQGDPLADIRILQDQSKIRLVIKNGRPVSDRRNAHIGEPHVSVV
jgi:imidazolonepropionase-like amidohydrolase